MSEFVVVAAVVGDSTNMLYVTTRNAQGLLETKIVIRPRPPR